MGFVLWPRTSNVSKRVLPQFFTMCKKNWSRKIESKTNLCIPGHEGYFNREFILLRTTVNSDGYCITMENLKWRIRQVKTTWTMFLYQHNSVQPHTNVKTRAHLTVLSFEVLIHPPYSWDIISSTFYLFGYLKRRAERDLIYLGWCFDDHYITWLYEQLSELYENGTGKLISHWLCYTAKYEQSIMM